MKTANPFNSESLDEIPYTHQTDDGTGWEYCDEPYGGFLVVEHTECQISHPETGDLVSVPLASCIEFIDLDGACGEPGFLVEAKLVVNPDALSESSTDSVAGSCGWYDDDGEPVIDFYAVASYGFSHQIKHDWGAETWQDGFEAVKGACAFGGMACGFSLDQPMNRIGTTGWDVIQDAVFDIDAFDQSLARLKKARENAGLV